MKFPSAASQLRPLRQALQDGDSQRVVATLRADTTLTDDGCWEWQRRIQGGYPIVRAAGKNRMVHRLVAEAVHGPLGTEPVHHRCANTARINPDHLQPVTHRENVAEMLARNYYVRRIAELEQALALLDPGHPALRSIRAA